MQKKCIKIWSFQKKAVLLHAFSLDRKVPRDVKHSFADRKAQHDT